MTMRPELEHAFDTGVPIQEVIEIFVKYHCSLKEEQVSYKSWHWPVDIHYGSIFWDNSYPLFHSLAVHTVKNVSFSVSDRSLSIHRALTRDVISWLCDSKRKSNVYLINGSGVPGEFVDEYSRANVMSMICFRAQRFGGFFHARDLGGSIRQLSADLAASYSPYRRILIQTLIDYPGICDLPPHSLFKKLIHEPWKAVQHYHPGYATATPVVIFEYHESYSDLFHLIWEFALLPQSSPLLWIIFVNSDLKLPIQDLVGPLACRYIRLPVCYNEASADAALILHHKFSVLRRQYSDTFDDNEAWPLNEQIAQLSRVVLGVFEFIDVIIQFIGRAEDGGPRAHLETFLGYMADSPLPSDEQRYCALNHFYTCYMANIPPDVLDVTKAFSFTCLEYCFPLIGLLILVPFRFGTFLLYIHHLVESLRMKDSYKTPVRRFVENFNRPGQFYTPEFEYRQTYQIWLHFLSHSLDLRTILKSGVLRLPRVDLTELDVEIQRLKHTAASELCDICEMRTDNVLLLRKFDFRCLAHNCDNIELYNFASLINYLYEDEGDYSSEIVRVEPISPLDKEFIDNCQGLAEPYSFEDESEVPPISPKYVLLGFGDQTVLAVMASRKQYDETTEGVGRGIYSGVTIYTSAMLDYM